jgi:hypothetical protein
MRYNLFVNLKKTEVMTFVPRGRRSGPSGSGIVLRSQTLADVSVFRYLGVVLTRTGSLAAHVDLITQRARVSAIRTASLIHDLDIHDLTRMHCYFNAFVRAQWYGIELLPARAVGSNGIRFDFDEGTRYHSIRFDFDSILIRSKYDSIRSNG